MLRRIGRFLGEFNSMGLSQLRVKTEDLRLEIPDLIVWLEMKRSTLTIERTDGTASIVAKVCHTRTSSENINIAVAVSAPFNPAGVKLISGDRGISKTVTLTPRRASEEINLLVVRTAENNTMAGTLTYTIVLSTAYQAIDLHGTPKQLVVVIKP